MEIRLSKSNFRKTALALAVALVLAASLFAGWKSGLLASRQASLPGAAEAALLPATVAVIYTPDLSSGQAIWYEQVCAGMTAQGCELFKGLYGPAIWDALQSGRSAPVEARVVLREEIERLENGHCIWKAELTLTQETDAVEQAEIYLEIAYTQAAGEWLLERILFEEEAASRYPR